jgi:CHAT domain-containing protein
MLDVSAAQVSKTVQDLRSQLDPDSQKPFDTALSFALYRQLIAPIEEVIASKPRLSFVINGALTSLPPQVLVTSDPTGKALKDVLSTRPGSW